MGVSTHVTNLIQIHDQVSGATPKSADRRTAAGVVSPESLPSRSEPSGAGTSIVSTEDSWVGGKVPVPAVGRAGGELSERLMLAGCKKNENKEKGKRKERERATNNQYSAQPMQCPCRFFNPTT